MRSFIPISYLSIVSSEATASKKKGMLLILLLRPEALALCRVKILDHYKSWNVKQFFFVALWKLSVRIFFNQLNWAVVIRPDDTDLMDAIEHPYLQDGCIVSALFVVLEQFKQQLYSAAVSVCSRHHKRIVTVIIFISSQSPVRVCV